MDAESLFVVTIASEKGGVGKTTIATNLAVYLKALCEDLPVTIASFDNHFSVDNMFAIGASQGATVAALFADEALDQAVTLGEYGVHYLRSERNLTPPHNADSGLLRRRLTGSGLTGILVLDTRPLLDEVTRMALAAADLVLIPVKDRPSLVNAAAVVRAAGQTDADGRVWLVPSLIDGRLRLENGAGMRDYLTLMAAERDLPLAPVAIAKSPKVESLAAGFGSRIHPVLTRARSTAVHRQLRDLARFVLERHQQAMEQGRLRCTPAGDDSLPARRRQRLLPVCPVCARPASAAGGGLCIARSGRRLAVVHGACLNRLFEQTGITVPSDDRLRYLAVELVGRGLSGAAAAVSLSLFDERAVLQRQEQAPPAAVDMFETVLARMTGDPDASLTRETAVILVGGQPPVQLLRTPPGTGWHGTVKKVLRVLGGQG